MRRVLISGGSRGIGRAIVEAFAAGGDRVAFIYRTREEEAAKVAEAFGAVAIKADVSDPMDVRRAIAEAETALGGPIDVLVNNAAVSWIGQMQDMTDEEWRRAKKGKKKKKVHKPENQNIPYHQRTIMLQYMQK